MEKATTIYTESARVMRLGDDAIVAVEGLEAGHDQIKSELGLGLDQSQHLSARPSPHFRLHIPWDMRLAGQC
jgi:hypothetical protein